MQRSFTVRAIWDEKAGVYVSESDIVGLHIEAATLDEFEGIMMELGPELIRANHVPGDADINATTFRDYVPAIVWQRPDHSQVAA